MKAVNVLIVDDNPITADCIQKRLEKVNACFEKDAVASVKSFYCAFSISDLQVAGQSIENCIINNSIDFLLLDRGFFDITDPNTVPDKKLDVNYLYVAKGQKSVKINQILEKVSFNRVKKLKGVIVYSFDEPSQTSEWYVEPAQIKRQITEIVGNKVNERDVEILLTNTEIYSLAGINIYELAGRDYNDEFIYQGRRADFSLYGLFVGEVLYHRILRILQRGRQDSIKTKQIYSLRKVILLFLIFSALSIGSNAAYSLLLKPTEDDRILFLVSLVFSLLLPILVLQLKPEWVISIDED